MHLFLFMRWLSVCVCCCAGGKQHNKKARSRLDCGLYCECTTRSLTACTHRAFFLCVCDLTSPVGVSLLDDLPVCSKYCKIRRVAVDVTQRHVVSHGRRQEEGHKGALCNISLGRHVAKVLNSTNYGLNCKVELRINAGA